MVEIILITFFLGLIIYSSVNGLEFVEFIPSIAVLAAALFKFVPTINRCMVSIQRLEGSKPAIENIYEKLNLYEENKINKIEKNSYPLKFDNEISLKDIKFSFSGSDENVLEGLNLKIKKNQKIGICGDTGSGKSTLAKIIMGVIPPTDGSILVDGQNINEKINSWQKIISYIPQKIFLFESSLKNNIKLFQDDDDDNKFNEIIKKVFLDSNLFFNLSNDIKENHSKLSGGELKKIGVARAFYKDHEVLIIDEGTAGLDSAYAKYIISEILKIEKTVVFVSHDLDLLKNFDVIYKLESKKVVQ